VRPLNVADHEAALGEIYLHFDVIGIDLGGFLEQ
jgi:hypothetical protein